MIQRVQDWEKGEGREGREGEVVRVEESKGGGKRQVCNQGDRETETGTEMEAEMLNSV